MNNNKSVIRIYVNFSIIIFFLCIFIANGQQVNTSSFTVAPSSQTQIFTSSIGPNLTFNLDPNGDGTEERDESEILFRSLSEEGDELIFFDSY